MNPALPTGEVELAVGAVDLLADAETPPFQIDEDEPVGEELRLRYRYLDLRKEAMRRNLELRHEVVRTIREHLNERGFLEVETPILTRSTPEGARDFLVPSRLSPGSWYALPQSPQLFKQLLVMGGTERYYQIARCFRDEDFRADRQPEFTQLDLEMGFVEEEDVHHADRRRCCRRCWRSAASRCSLPIERVPYDELMLRYGSDRPDRRLGVEIEDLTEVFRGSEFKVFSGAVESGGVVRAIKAGGEWPRSRFDALTERAQSLGAKGLAWAVVEAGRLALADREVPVRGRDRAGPREALGAARGRRDPDRGGPARRWPPACSATLRVEVADVRARGPRPVLGHRLPDVRLERGRGALGRDAPPVHLPSGRPRRRSGHLAQPRLRRGAGRLGARRRLDPDQPPRRAAAGVRRARHRTRRRPQERFGFLLEALRYGAPPHGGIAFGIDRIAALLAGRESIRDVIAFPKAASGADPLTGAPAPVDERQLRELGLRLDAPGR